MKRLARMGDGLLIDPREVAAVRTERFGLPDMKEAYTVCHVYLRGGAAFDLFEGDPNLANLLAALVAVTA